MTEPTSIAESVSEGVSESVTVGPTLKFHQELKSQSDAELGFTTQMEFQLKNLDISLANGLRRVLLAEVPCLSIGPAIDLPVEKNITVFNSQYLKDRLSMQAIHLDSPADLEKHYNIQFRLCDPKYWDQPLQNTQNENLHFTLNDLIVLEDQEMVPESQQIDYSVTAKPVETGIDVASELSFEGDDDDDDMKAPDEIAFQEQLESHQEAVAQAHAREQAFLADEVPTAPKGPGAEPGAEETSANPEVDRETRQKALELRFKRRDPQEFFSYLPMYLLTLKKGESIWASMKPSQGIGQEHARWTSGLISYRFQPIRADVVDDPEKWEEFDYDPIKDRQEYAKSKNTAGFYGTPETFNISLEYNGHYRPQQFWLSSIEVLKKKLQNFQADLRQISEKSGGQVTPHMSVEFSSPDDIPNLVTLTLSDQDHTLGNIVFSHYLYHLHQMILNLSDGKAQLSDEILQGFSHYRVPHPLDNKLVIELRVPNFPKERLDTGFNSLLKEDNNPYDDEFFMSAPSIRLLMIVLENVLETISDLESEAQNLLEMSDKLKVETENDKNENDNSDNDNDNN